MNKQELYLSFYNFFLNNIFQSLFFVIKNILYTTKIYRSDTVPSSSFRSLISNIHNLNGIKIGTELYQSMSIPLVVLTWNMIVITTIDHIGIHGNINIVITVYNLSFTNNKTLLPVRFINDKKEICNDSINILEICGNRVTDTYLIETVELTIPFDHIDTIIWNNIKNVVESIIDDYNNNKSQISKVYILHGSPGCGKSTTLRILTNKLNGILFSEYDPTKVHSIKNIIRNYKDIEPLIIGYEEFDVSFDKIINDNVKNDYEDIILDAINKASWNNLIDYIKRKKNIIFIMTTNKTIDQIKDMVKKDSSYFRSGRVDAHFIWPEKIYDFPKKIITHVVSH